MVQEPERRLHAEAYVGNRFYVLIKNFRIVCTALELCNVFLLLKTHEDSVCEILAIGVLYAACIQYITNTKLKFILIN